MSPRHATPDRRTARRQAVVALAALVVATAGAPQAWGHPVTATAAVSACARVEGYRGSAQILDETRTAIHEVGETDQVPCGSWIAVGEGWVWIRDRLGHSLRLGGGSFVQLTEDPDEVVLFRGLMYGRASKTELRVITPNARARASEASLLVLFDPVTKRTQVVALDRTVELENRFEKSHRLTLNAGTLSELDFRLPRILPRRPRPVTPDSLEASLTALQVPEGVRRASLRLAKRQISKGIVKIARAATGPARSSPRRSPAGLVFDGDDHGSSRGGAGNGAGALRAHRAGSPSRRLDRHLVGGERDAVALLFPGRPKSTKPRFTKPRFRKSVARVPAVAPHGVAREGTGSRVDGGGGLSDPDVAEKAEKRRLIEELSRIQTE